MNIFKAMVPDAVYKDMKSIPFDELYKSGKTTLLLDFDNTLGPDRSFAPNDYSFDCIKMVQDYGFKCILVSNAKSSRSSGIAEKLNIPCVTYAKKPKPDGVIAAMEKMNVTKDESVMIGDQIFTDVMAGKFAGVYTIMVEKYKKKEKWYILIKRPFEAIVRFFAKF